MKKAVMSMAALAACLAVGLAPQGANADGAQVYGGSGHGGGKCSGEVRIQAADATCLDASWNKMAGTLHSLVTVSNACASYGRMVVSVEVVGKDDPIHFHLKGTATQRSRSNPVDNAYCCLNRADNLCWEDQVEKKADGTVRKVTVSGNTYTSGYVDVSTQQARYDFCQGVSDQIYCDVDPEGDAHINPQEAACAATSSCNCGDHWCTVDDCTSKFNASQMVEGESADPQTAYCSARSPGISSSSGDSQLCVFAADCWTGRNDESGNKIIETHTVSGEVDNIADLRYCPPGENETEGRVQDSAC